VWQKRGEVFLGQGKHVVKILQKFGMMDYKSMATPMVTDLRKLRHSDSNPIDSSLYQQLIGSLMYLVNTRPDICFVVNILSQFQVEPRQEHWVATKHILRYLRGMIIYGLRYASKSEVKLHGFTNSDWAGNAEDRKSTYGLCFSLSYAMISWASRKQKSIALCIAKADYIAACDACMEAVWLRKLVSRLFDQVLDSTMIYCDNQSCVKLSKNPVFHEMSKHIEIKYYFLRDKVQRGEVVLQYISTDEQTADILTKPLSKIKFAYLRDKLGLVEIGHVIPILWITKEIMSQGPQVAYMEYQETT
jgi:hypothetical protein